MSLRYSATRCEAATTTFHWQLRVQYRSQERSNFRFQGNALRLYKENRSYGFSLASLTAMNHYAAGSIADTDKACVLWHVIAMKGKILSRKSKELTAYTNTLFNY